MADEITRNIVRERKEYASIDEMPPEIRAVYEKAMSLLADEDADGVPDIVEEKGVWQAAKEVWGVAREAQRSGIQSIGVSGEVEASMAEEGVPDARPSFPAGALPLEPRAVGGGLGRLILLIVVAVGVAFVLKRLGVIP